MSYVFSKSKIWSRCGRFFVRFSTSLTRIVRVIFVSLMGISVTMTHTVWVTHFDGWNHRVEREPLNLMEVNELWLVVNQAVNLAQWHLWSFVGQPLNHCGIRFGWRCVVVKLSQLKITIIEKKSMKNETCYLVWWYSGPIPFNSHTSWNKQNEILEVGKIENISLQLGASK